MSIWIWIMLKRVKFLYEKINFRFAHIESSTTFRNFYVAHRICTNKVLQKKMKHRRNAKFTRNASERRPITDFGTSRVESRGTKLSNLSRLPIFILCKEFDIITRNNLFNMWLFQSIFFCFYSNRFYMDFDQNIVIFWFVWFLSLYETYNSIEIISWTRIVLGF